MNSARKLKLEVSETEDNLKMDSSDKLAGYFYKIVNHEELFKIGKGLLLEVEKGVKNFAFTSTGYKNSQQRTILGLCCFFDQNASYKICIVSDHLSQGVFKDLIDSSSLNSYSIGSGEDIVKYKSFHHHFDFIDYSELSKFYGNHLYTKTFDAEVASILSRYDIILWDIPEMEKMKQNPHFHYRVSHFYESLTVIVSQSTSSGKQVEFIKNFFSNYNINLNGVLFDTSSLKERPKRRKILGIF
ncbi:MAG: hypothetical protein WC635_04960 [Bacteriovorax sp.]|jgi:hypothetical protein